MIKWILKTLKDLTIFIFVINAIRINYKINGKSVSTISEKVETSTELIVTSQVFPVVSEMLVHPFVQNLLLIK